jgi:hypothetical protein
LRVVQGIIDGCPAQLDKNALQFIHVFL